MRKVLVLLAVALLAFAGGAVASFGYFFSKITKQIESGTESVLLEKTMVLQFLRDGHKDDAEFQLESISWNHLISLGHRVERSEPVPESVRPAIDYHCEYFKAHKGAMDPKQQEQRTYWCSLLQKG